MHEAWAGFAAGSWLLNQWPGWAPEGEMLPFHVPTNFGSHPLAFIFQQRVWRPWQLCEGLNRMRVGDDQKLIECYWVDVPSGVCVQVDFDWQSAGVVCFFWRVSGRAQLLWRSRDWPVGTRPEFQEIPHWSGAQFHWFLLEPEAQVIGDLRWEGHQPFGIHGDWWFYQRKNSVLQWNWRGLWEKGGLSASLWSWLGESESQANMECRHVLKQARVHVQPGVSLLAPQTRASVTLRALRLAPEAIVFGRPVLDVVCNQVEAHHGLAVSGLNPEALFYLQSRGFAPPQAEKILVDAFLSGI